MKKRLPIILIFLFALAGSLLAADTYSLDPAHSSVTFCAKHMVLSTVCGKFREFEATILLDEKDITKSSWSGKIKTPSITTDVEKRDAHLKSPDFFDVEKYPEITFQSSKIEKAKDGYVAVGNLKIRDVSKEVRIPFTLTGPVAMGDKKKIGIEANLTINRQDYGVSWSQKLDSGGLVVSDEIKISLNAEAAQAK